MLLQAAGEPSLRSGAMAGPNFQSLGLQLEKREIIMAFGFPFRIEAWRRLLQPKPGQIRAFVVGSALAGIAILLAGVPITNSKKF